MMSIKSEKSKHNSSSNDPKIDDTNLANVLNEVFDNGELLQLDKSVKILD